MLRVLLVLAVLGVLALGAEGVLLALLLGMTPSSLSLQLQSVELFSLFLGVPGLGVLVSILGAAAASRRGATGWLSLFVIFEALTFILALAGPLALLALLHPNDTVSPPDPTPRTIASVVVYIAFLFPIVDFVTALLYVWHVGRDRGRHDLASSAPGAALPSALSCSRPVTKRDVWARHGSG